MSQSDQTTYKEYFRMCKLNRVVRRNQLNLYVVNINAQDDSLFQIYYFLTLKNQNLNPAL